MAEADDHSMHTFGVQPNVAANDQQERWYVDPNT